MMFEKKKRCKHICQVFFLVNFTLKTAIIIGAQYLQQNYYKFVVYIKYINFTE